MTELFGDDANPLADPLLDRLQQVTREAYDVSGELGRGGMAVVYAGTDRQLQRRVAIKVMDPRLSMTQGMAARFLQEARIAARLQHPNIIVVHDVRRSEELTYFVMSLIDGVAVDELCRAVRPIPVDQIRWILLQATRALAYAHSEGIVHRDIKPANILLNLKGDVILTDFGIAKALGDTGLTQSGTQVGTPVYMSPEQFSGEVVGPSCDQYALGITAYQLLAGAPPFAGDLYQLIAAHGAKAPVPLREVRPDCPAFLANAVMRMLEKDPADRWPSLEDLQDVFGANMAMDGGAARRKLAETVRALRQEGAGLVRDGEPAVPSSGEQATDSLVVTISPPGATIFVSGSLELRASVALDTGSSLPGAAVQWRSSDEAVLRVQSNGTVVGISPGTVVVRAAVNGAWSDATIRVEAAPIARLSLTTPNVTMRVGDVLRPEVVAVDVNGNVCTGVAMAWISRSPTVADMEEPGVVRAIAPGMAMIDVSAGNVRRSLDVVVMRRPITQLRVQSPVRSLELGGSTQLAIEAFDDQGERVDATPVRWTSSAPSVIHVDSTGRALAIASGGARLTASVDEAVDFVELEAIEPPIGSVQLSLADERVEIGDEILWTLRVKDVGGASRSTAGVRIWSSDPAVVQVDEANARAWAVGLGEALLHAGPETGPAGPLTSSTAVRVVVTEVIVARLDVFPHSLDLEAGAVAALNVQAVDRRGIPVLRTEARWEVDDPGVALLEGNGIVRALAPGTCTVRTSFGNADGTVVDAVISVRVRRASIARLDITCDRGMLEVGETTVLRVTTYDAMELEVADAVPTWRSSKPTVARVERDGQVVALAPGRTTITAELEGKQGQVALLVAPPVVETVRLTAPTGELVVGRPVLVAATAFDRNGQEVVPPLTWRVEPADAASISAVGEVRPMRPGTFTVRASLVVPSDSSGILSARNPIEASLILEARAPRVQRLHFASGGLELAVGRTAQPDLRVDLDVDAPEARASSPTVTWTSSAPEVATVEADGRVRAVGEGTARIAALADGQQAALDVRVIPAAAGVRWSRPLLLAGAMALVIGLAWGLWPAGAGDRAAPGSIPDAVARSAPELGEAPRASEETGRVRSDAADAVSPDVNADAAVAASATLGGRTAPPTASSPAATAATLPVPGRTAAAAPQADRATSPAAAPNRAVASSATPPAENPVTANPAVTATPPSSERRDTAPPVETRPVSPPPSTRPSVSPEAPPAAVPAAVLPPTPPELRAVADRIAREAGAGTGPISDDLRQFLRDGAEHNLTVGAPPTVTATDGGRVQAQFPLALSRFNSGGIRERRVSVVQMSVERRGADVVLLSTVFGPIVRR